MKNTFPFLTLAAVALGVSSSQAQLEQPASRSKHNFGLSYRAGFNISADFHNLGGFASAASPGPATGGGFDRIYDDGYNRVDISGNSGGQTWFWGYEDASQLVNSGSIVFSAMSSPANVSSLDRDGDPQHGFEINYQLELGDAWKESTWGFEGAFNYTDLSIRDNRTVFGNVNRISDAFAIGAIVPPLAPYAGTFGGPGPIISDSPNRSVTTIANGAAIAGRREIDAHLFGLRVGPYWEIPLNDSLSLSLGGGLVLANADSRFAFQESVAIAGSGTAFSAGTDNENEFMVGGYLSGQVNVAVTEGWHLFGGVQYQNIGKYSHRSGIKTATVDLGESFFVNIGAGFSF